VGDGLRRLNATGEMHACVKRAQFQHEGLVAAVALDKGRSGGNILNTPFGEVVENDDVMAAKQQKFGGRRTNESGGTGDENSHAPPPFPDLDPRSGEPNSFWSRITRVHERRTRCAPGYPGTAYLNNRAR
jgi:hypothetical protein